MNEDVIARAKKISLVIFDVDGVLTDGSLFFGDDGQEYKAFNSRDGHGMKMLQNSGVKIAIITGRTSKVVAHRMANLNIDIIFQGQADKKPAFEIIMKQQNLTADQIAYVGDDVVDLPVMIKVGLAVGVENSHELVKQYAHWIAPTPAGRGAARDVCELIMKAQGNYGTAMQAYLQ
ncbi:MAG: 3-deoxy-manno-octulosonate-8-phosphatase KdsC [Thiohalomonadales bacterium]